MGVIRANPSEYVSRYGSSLRVARDLPDFVREIPAPNGVTLAADYKYSEQPELEGDVQALSLVDLDREGLSEYRSQLQRLGISYTGGANSTINEHASFSTQHNSVIGSNLNYGANTNSSNIAKSSSYFHTSGPTFSTNQNVTNNSSGQYGTSASGQFGATASGQFGATASGQFGTTASGQFSSIIHNDRASSISNQVLGNSYGINGAGTQSVVGNMNINSNNQGRASAASFQGGFQAAASSANLSSMGQGFNQTTSYNNNNNSSNYNSGSSNYNPSSSPLSNIKPSGGLTQNYSLSSSIPLVNVNSFLNDVFAQVDKDNNGKITIEEAEKVLLRINSRLGRSYGEDEVKAFFMALDTNRDGFVDLHEFQCAFERLL